MDAIRACCAGLDVHQETVVACLLKGPLDRKPQSTVRIFGTTSRELLELRDWLEEEGCTEVAMESTGVLWKPVWNILQDACELTLANPGHIKGIPGQKTDVKDAEWIAQLHRCGLIKPSFVPPLPIQQLRDYVRYRRKLIQQMTQEKNRVHKLLQNANVKLTTYVSDIFGVSGRRLLHKLANGEVMGRQELLMTVKTHLKRKIPQLLDALDGRFTAHHRRMLALHLDFIETIQEQIASVEQEIDKLASPYEEEIGLLDTIPGINRDGAIEILSEIGADMSVFATDAHLASWAKVCPGNNESAGVKKKSRPRKGNKWLKGTLSRACKSICDTKPDCRISAFYQRIKRRHSGNIATVAATHLYLRIIHHMLTERIPYQEWGRHYADEQLSRHVARLTKQLNRLGYEVKLAPVPA